MNVGLKRMILNYISHLFKYFRDTVDTSQLTKSSIIDNIYFRARERPGRAKDKIDVLHVWTNGQ